jgi:hypothetical protein
MPRQPIKQALSKSLGAEDNAVRSRITKADAYFDPKAAKKEETGSLSSAPRLIRDSFTFPPDDYAIIQEIIDRCLRQGIHVKKSEVLRAALRLLAVQPDAKIEQAVTALPKLKTGRPKGTSLP